MDQMCSGVTRSVATVSEVSLSVTVLNSYLETVIVILATGLRLSFRVG